MSGSRRLAAVFLFVGFFPVFTASAVDGRIAVLEFELNDLTLDPRTTEEVARTASIKPLLQERLADHFGYEIAAVDGQDERRANKGLGYLFDRPELAAGLGKTAGADWIVVGRVHKASFLFVYFKAKLIHVKSGRVVGDFVVEVKGPQKMLTGKGVNRLAEQIAHAIDRPVPAAFMALPTLPAR